MTFQKTSFYQVKDSNAAVVCHLSLYTQFHSKQSEFLIYIAKNTALQYLDKVLLGNGLNKKK